MIWLTLGIGCGGGTSDLVGGDSSIIPLSSEEVEPPVAGSTGDGLQSGIDFRDASTDIDLVAQRFFAGEGPTNIFTRLEDVDLRVGGLVERSKDQQRACVLDAPTVLPLGGSLPEGDSFDLSLQCEEAYDEGIYVYGGMDAEATFHLAQLQPEEARKYGLFAQVPAGGEQAEIWLVDWTEDSGVEGFSDGWMMHIKADSAAPNLEMTIGGTSATTSVSCGIHLRTNTEYVYAIGVFSDVFNANGDVTDCAAEEGVSYCVDGDTLAEVDMSLCEDAGLTELELNSLNSDNVDLDELAAIGETTYAGLTSFDDIILPE